MRIARRLVLPAMAALAVPAAALATHLPMSFGVTGPGDLVAGVEVQLPVEVTCPPITPGPFAFATASISVTQRVGQFVTSGMASVPSVICDGSAHAYVVRVRPSAGSRAFHGGPALAVLSGLVCTFDPVTFRQDCTSTQVSTEIRIHG